MAAKLAKAIFAAEMRCNHEELNLITADWKESTEQPLSNELSITAHSSEIMSQSI
jgi:hypothetical protein